MLCNATLYNINPLIHCESARNDNTHFNMGLPAKGVVHMNTKVPLGAELIDWFIILFFLKIFFGGFSLYF